MCDEHNAEWLANGMQPPMPKRYSDVAPPPSLADELRRKLAAAAIVQNELADLPMLSPADHRRMYAAGEEIESAYSTLRTRRTESLRPLQEAIVRINKMYAPLLERYEEITAQVRMRADAYEAKHPKSIPVHRRPSKVVPLRGRKHSEN